MTDAPEHIARDDESCAAPPGRAAQVCVEPGQLDADSPLTAVARYTS